jgi:hypothetical protein
MSHIIYAMDEYRYPIGQLNREPVSISSFRRDGLYQVWSHCVRKHNDYEVVVFVYQYPYDPFTHHDMYSVEFSTQSDNESSWIRDTTRLLQLYASDPLV